MIYTWSPGRLKNSQDKFTVQGRLKPKRLLFCFTSWGYFFFLSTSQRGRTNEFDSKQLLSGNYPRIMYHHVITLDNIQSLWKIICTVCLISKPFICLNLWEKHLRVNEHNINIKNTVKILKAETGKMNNSLKIEAKFHNPNEKDKHYDCEMWK